MWKVAVPLLACWIIVYLALFKGVKVTGKVRFQARRMSQCFGTKLFQTFWTKPKLVVRIGSMVPLILCWSGCTYVIVLVLVALIALADERWYNWPPKMDILVADRIFYQLRPAYLADRSDRVRCDSRRLRRWTQVCLRKSEITFIIGELDFCRQQRLCKDHSRVLSQLTPRLFLPGRKSNPQRKGEVILLGNLTPSHTQRGCFFLLIAV